MLFGEVVVQLDDTVETVTCRSDGAEEITDGGRQPSDQASRPKPVRSDQLCRERTFGNTMGSQPRQGRVDPGVRGLSGLSREADDVVLLLKGEEIERLVFENGPANASTPVLIAQLGRFRGLRSRDEKG